MKNKFSSALSLALIVSMLFTSVAFADQVVNNIDTTIDSGLETRTITSGGSTVVGFFIQPSNTIPSGDANGCNATGNDPATVNLSVPVGVTAIPSSLTFSGCGVTQNVTFSSNTVNTTGYTISIASVTGGKDGSLWSTAPAEFTLKVIPPADSTPPVITPSVVGTLGDNGWYTSDVTVSWTVVDNESTPTYSCPPTTINADTAGTPVSCTATSAGGTSSESVTIKRDATAPTITFDSPSNSVWYTADVTANWTCSDATSGAVNALVSASTSGEGSSIPATGTCTDNAGNTASDTQNFMVDKTDPAVTVTPDRGPDLNGWYNAPVTFDTAGTDATSGVSDANCTADQTYTGPDGTGLMVNGSCTDNAGNVGNGASDPFNFDDTDPLVSVALDRSPAGTWFNLATGAPVAQFTCSDATSGVASCPVDYTFPEGADQSHSGTAYDNAGNSATEGVSSVYVDLTAPTLTWDPAMIADGASFYFGFVPAWPPNPCAAVDSLSGPAGCSVADSHPGGFGAVGIHNLTATAYDVAGNSYSETRTYTVLAWTLSGFYQPVDMGGVFNTVKGGSTVPLKFEIFAGTTELKLTSYVTGFSALAVPCPVNGFVADEIEVLATGGTSLRFDTTGDQFIFNWQTPKKPGACYKVTMTTLDGSSLSAFFKLK